MSRGRRSTDHLLKYLFETIIGILSVCTIIYGMLKRR